MKKKKNSNNSKRKKKHSMNKFMIILIIIIIIERDRFGDNGIDDIDDDGDGGQTCDFFSMFMFGFFPIPNLLRSKCLLFVIKKERGTKIEIEFKSTSTSDRKKISISN